jgi:hypothetical protein
MSNNQGSHRAILQSIAHRVMLEGGLLPDFSAEALSQLGRIKLPAAASRDIPNAS